MNREIAQILKLRFCLHVLFLAVVLSAPSTSFAESNDSSPNTHTSDSKKLEELVDRVCGEVLREKATLWIGDEERASTSHYSKVGERIDNRFLSFLKIDRQTPNYQQLIASFYNLHQNNFICKANTHYGKKHLFKVLIDMQMYQPVLFEYFLHEDRKNLFSVNAFEIKKGKPETLLGYLWDIKTGINSFQNYNIPEVYEVIEIIEDEYGALRGKDLQIQASQQSNLN